VEFKASFLRINGGERKIITLAAIAHIFVATKRGAAMEALDRVEAVTNGGLRGDRYTDYQVTFIELENIEAFTQSTGLALAPHMPRRNIVTRGVRLNELRGKRFRVGQALFEGLELCEPCSLFARRTHREVVGFFAGKGGLRAGILSGGEIRVGQAIEEDLT
jgi:MOSC domain-containing protein YiiM